MKKKRTVKKIRLKRTKITSRMIKEGVKVRLKECSEEEYGVYSPEEDAEVLGNDLKEYGTIVVRLLEYDRSEEDGLRELTLDQVKEIL